MEQDPFAEKDETSSDGSRSLADVEEIGEEEEDIAPLETFANEQHVEQAANKELEGKRWSDGGYSYGFDCTKRSWESSLMSSIESLKQQQSVISEAKSEESSFDYDYMTTGHLCPVADEVVAVHNRTQIKFVFLRTGRSRLFVPPSNIASNRGIGVIAGRDDLSVLAWSDIGPPSPKIHIYQYASPSDIKTLEGEIKFLSKLDLKSVCFSC